MGEASADLLCTALGTTLQERCRQIEECAKESSKNDQRFRKHDLEKRLKELGLFSLEKRRLSMRLKGRGSKG